MESLLDAPETDLLPATQPDGPTASEPDEPTEPTSEMIDQEIALIDRVYETYRRYLEASQLQGKATQRVREAEEELSECREETSGRKSILDELLKTFPEELLAIRDPGARAIIQSIADQVSDDPAGQQPEPSAAPASEPTGGAPAMDYQEWAQLSTELITGAGIAGLGKKKQEQLLDAFPTLGHLEDARTEASSEHVHFAKKLPKGFGEMVADAIESLMSDLLMKPQSETDLPATAKPAAEQPAVSESNGQVQPQSSVESPIEPPADSEQDGEPNDPDDTDDIYASEDEDEDEDDIDGAVLGFDDGEDYDDVEGFDDSPEPAEAEPDPEADWSTECMIRLESDPEEVTAGWGIYDSDHPEAWSQGFKAQDEWEVDANPYDYQDAPEDAIQWVRGWLAKKNDLDL